MFNFFKERSAEPTLSVQPTQQYVASFHQFADGSTVEILLPRLCGSRQAAAKLMEQARVQLAKGKLVQLNARLTTVGTESYADELITLLAKERVKKLLVTPTTLEFERYLLAAGKKHGLVVELVS